MQITFKGESLKLVTSRHLDGRIGLELLEADDSHFATCTMNPNHEQVKAFGIQDDEVVIMNHDENVGILDVLIELNVVTFPSRFLFTSELAAPICNLNFDVIGI